MSLSRFVLATSVGDTEVTLDRIAFKGTNQIRPDAVWSFQSVAAHFAVRGQGRR